MKCVNNLSQYTEHFKNLSPEGKHSCEVMGGRTQKNENVGMVF